MVCGNRDPADKQALVYDSVIERGDGLHNLFCRGSLLFQICGAVCVFWNLTSIAVCCHGPGVFFRSFRLTETFTIISNCENDLVGYKLFRYQVKRQHIRHFPDDHAGLIHGIWGLEDLSGSHAV